ncbi:hypothetical protein C2S52_004524 [Perilla frutescens var. hirtella]|uniref:Uncharacterized protein n=1 Tax=Perilla frutescens var. hirtella TaxID=608512 RepID=A0AAD4P4Q2_PERFH|nr:hypothetical protein C2S51_011071 [Perilla frutescens var. frutescens]KAH6794047.1 hypothetical protein C2S52_004524 [Perilla frutescens var. hirtella]KAH6825957.1 hypothetical protein C2S53_001394 [Perilla frutescens var. hirtella]
MAATVEEDSKKKPQPQLVKLDYAFKLAEQWVNNMSKSSMKDKSPSTELEEGRPLRLGIGAAVPRESKFTRSSDPVERKLLAKLHNEKRRVAMELEGLAPSAENRNGNEDSQEEESESKTKAFVKRRPLGSISSLHAKKKHRW